MEVEMLPLSDDDQTRPTLPERGQSSKRPNKKTRNWRPLGVVCLMIAFLAILAVVAILKSTPNNQNSIGTADKKEDIATTVPTRRKSKQPTASIETPTKISENISIDIGTPYIVLKKSMCSLRIGKIAFVQMSGEHRSSIWDDKRTNAVSKDDRNRQHQTVTVYEDTIYRLHVQLDCGGQRSSDYSDNACDLSQHVKVWIDFNDNGFEYGESRVPYRPWSNDNVRGGTYDLEIQIPAIDGTITKPGNHKMRIAVLPDEEYERDCGTTGYNETKEYTVNVIPKASYPVADDRISSNIVYRDPLCSLNTAKIVLVIMAGERGTQIRDDTPANTLMHVYHNQHHMAVTAYEHTIYLIRVQLDCSWQLNRDLFENGCNLAQDVNLWIDLNDDNRFDESEIAAPYRWPVTSYMPQGIYDLQIHIPLIDGRYMKTGRHTMRVVAMSSESYRTTCGRYDYNETRLYTINIIDRMNYQAQFELTTPYMVLSNAVCPVRAGKIALVIMAGEHRTQIRDDASTRAIMSSDKKYQQHLSIVLHEGTVYLLRIQLDCGQQWSRDSFENNCHLAYDVNAWIDTNDNGTFENSENVAPFRWPLHSYIPQGVYDLQISVPVIDGRRMKSGPHRMRLTVALNRQYRRQCGNNDYGETRDYQVTIVPNTQQPVDNGLPYLTLSDSVCSQTNSRIVLVLMTGELGTHIRDNVPTNTLLSQNQNRHHLAITLYENTMYRLRIQLDCYQPSSRGFLDINCNLAQDVNVWIDLNNDGKYDEAESRIPHRWPLQSSLPLGIYDLEVYIPVIDVQNMRRGAHIMRIVAMPSQEYRKKCGATDFSETREYSINIIPKTTYGYTNTYCPPGNLVCADGHSAIFLVELFGEQNTRIHDDTKTCSTMNNYNDRSDLVLTLFDNTVYTLRVQLYCVQQWRYDNSYIQDPSLFETICNHAHYLDVWMDFNNDGIFDTSSERISSSDRYRDDHRTTEYALSITIPQIDRRNYLDGQHRMRVVLTQDERNRKPCYSTGYGEARDYLVQIMPKIIY